MKRTLELPDTIEACHEIIISRARLIEQLQRRAFGGSLKDRAIKYDGPSLFDEVDEKAMLAAKRNSRRLPKMLTKRHRSVAPKPRPSHKAAATAPKNTIYTDCR